MICFRWRSRMFEVRRVLSFDHLNYFQHWMWISHPKERPLWKALQKFQLTCSMYRVSVLDLWSRFDLRTPFGSSWGPTLYACGLHWFSRRPRTGTGPCGRRLENCHVSCMVVSWGTLYSGEPGLPTSTERERESTEYSPVSFVWHLDKALGDLSPSTQKLRMKPKSWDMSETPTFILPSGNLI